MPESPIKTEMGKGRIARTALWTGSVALLTGFGLGILVSGSESTAKASKAIVTQEASLLTGRTGDHRSSLPTSASNLVEFYQQVDSLTSDQLCQQIRELYPLRGRSGHRMTMKRMAEFLVLKDPQTALLLNQDLPDLAIFDAAFRSLASKDLEQGLATMEALPDVDNKRKAMSAIIEGLAEQDPSAAFILLAKSPTARSDAYFGLFEQWALRDPLNAVAAVDALTSPAARNAAIRALAEVWAEDDPVAALTWIEQGTLAASEKQLLMGSALAALAKEDASRALAKVESSDMDIFTRHRLLPKVLSELFKQDQSAAIDWARVQDNPVTKDRILGDAARMLAVHDPQLVISLARSLDEFDLGLSSAWTNLAKKDFDAAKVAFANWQSDSMPERYVKEIAEAVGRKRPESVLAWAETLDPANRSRAVDAALADYAEEDPASAASLLSAQGQATTDEEPELGAFKSIAENWADVDPHKAAEWASSLPEGEGRSKAIQALADEWTAADPVGASAWVASLPPGPDRDAAAVELIDQVMRHDPEGALTWASSLTTGRDIDRYTSRVFETWLRMDPKGAQVALQSENLSPSVVARFSR